uniref:ornithine decarboxylase n=1 Tax=Anopheles farauti TaxID=69004 RepID=A0A182QGE5_9DIPT
MRNENTQQIVKNLLSRVQCLEDDTSLRHIIHRVVASGPHDEPIHVLDVDTVVYRYTEWIRQMPRVKLYYAIKSNDADAIVETIALLGGGFDCASQAELERVLNLGVPPASIIYAQPSKSVPSLQLSRARGIRTVFDNEFELEKIAQHHPDAELLLRYRYDSTNSKVNLGTKFGCDVGEEARQLLDRARELSLNVVGWCFNVGSMSYDAEVFYGAIRAGRAITDYAASIGFQFRVLDIGGGFVGNKDDNIARYAYHINRALNEFFPDESLEVFAEPGRYLCAAGVTNVARVQGKRYFRSGPKIESVGYYLNDGIYGTFYSTKYRGLESKVLVWKSPSECGPERSSKLFGPTCDGNDWFMANVQLPELDIGDTLVFESEGAYSSVHSCRFNGFPLPKVLAYLRSSTGELLKQVSNLHADSSLINALLLNSEHLKLIGNKLEVLSFEREQ